MSKNILWDQHMGVFYVIEWAEKRLYFDRPTPVEVSFYWRRPIDKMLPEDTVDMDKGLVDLATKRIGRGENAHTVCREIIEAYLDEEEEG